MSTRKSARLTAQAAAASVSAASSQPPQQKQRPRKRQETEHVKDDSDPAAERTMKSDSRVKGKRGHLRQVAEMPVDILLEIFRHLEPADLLHFSRASKFLREILLSNNSAFIWNSAHKNITSSVPPPVCPASISRVHYASYIYGKNCQFCGSIYGRSYHESALMRVCSKCIDAHMIRCLSNDPNAAENLCNSWAFPKVPGLYVLRIECGRRKRELVEVKKKGNLTDYVKRRQEELWIRDCFGNSISRWRRKVKVDRAFQTQIALRNRQAAIYERLKGEDLGIKVPSWRLPRLPHVRKVGELTDSEWQVIRADIIDAIHDDHASKQMEDMRRIMSASLRCLGQFLLMLNIPGPAIVPSVHHVASFEPIGVHIQSKLPKWVNPDFEKFRTEIVDIVDTWREDVDEFLAGLVKKRRKGRSEKGKKKALTDPLELATTFFKCHWCTEPIAYPRILVHGCLLKGKEEIDEGGEKDGEEDSEIDEDRDGESVATPGRAREPRAPKEITPEAAWESTLALHPTGVKAGNPYITFDEEAHAVARRIVEICGGDHATMTQAAMQEKDARLECLRCSRAAQGKARTRLVMNWTSAILHDLEDHYEEESTAKEPDWRLVNSEADLQRIRDLESKLLLKKWKQPSYCCRYCGARCQFRTKDHLITHHVKFEEDKIDEHFYVDLDAPTKNGRVKI